MAKLYYYYGAMGSSKTANALMTHFNYEEVGQKALLCKPAIDARDGERTVYSRIGLQHDCILLEELQQMKEEEIRGYDCIIVDEVQFATPQQVDFLSDIVAFLPHQHTVFNSWITSAIAIRRSLPGNSRLRKSARSP